MERDKSLNKEYTIANYIQPSMKSHVQNPHGTLCEACPATRLILCMRKPREKSLRYWTISKWKADCLQALSVKAIPLNTVVRHTFAPSQAAMRHQGTTPRGQWQGFHGACSTQLAGESVCLRCTFWLSRRKKRKDRFLSLKDSGDGIGAYWHAALHKCHEPQPIRSH